MPIDARKCAGKPESTLFMKILNEKIKLNDLKQLDGEPFFEDMVKCVVDVDKKLIAVSAELHADLEEFLIDAGSSNSSLYGINIVFDDGEIEFDSMINPPRNRADGFPRGGRDVSSPEKRKLIEEIVDTWIER